jgi:hypothetical protein
VRGPDQNGQSVRMTAQDYISQVEGCINHSSHRAGPDYSGGESEDIFNNPESSSRPENDNENQNEHEDQINGHASGRTDAYSRAATRHSVHASHRNVREEGTSAYKDVDLVPVRCVVGASVAAVRLDHRNKYGDDVLARIPSEPMRLETLEKEGKDCGYDMTMWKRVMFNVRNCPACNCRPVVVTGFVHLDKYVYILVICSLVCDHGSMSTCTCL